MSKTLEKWNFTAKCLNTFDAHCSSKFIITSVVLDIRDQSFPMAWWGEEKYFGGSLELSLREDQSQLRTQKRPGSLYLFRSL